MKFSADERHHEHTVAREILSRLGDRWSVLSLHMTEGGPLRFSELKRKIERVRPISSRVLTRTLKQLERDGLVSRKVFPVVPPRVKYSLTRLGERFLHFAGAIKDWAIESRTDFEMARATFEARAAGPSIVDSFGRKREAKTHVPQGAARPTGRRR
jgi:DNA-binding HxlR family transcriptional regulator